MILSVWNHKYNLLCRKSFLLNVLFLVYYSAIRIIFYKYDPFINVFSLWCKQLFIKLLLQLVIFLFVNFSCTQRLEYTSYYYIKIVFHIAFTRSLEITWLKSEIFQEFALLHFLISSHGKRQRRFSQVQIKN